MGRQQSTQSFPWMSFQTIIHHTEIQRLTMWRLETHHSPQEGAWSGWIWSAEHNCRFCWAFLWTFTFLGPVWIRIIGWDFPIWLSKTLFICFNLTLQHYFCCCIYCNINPVKHKCVVGWEKCHLFQAKLKNLYSVFTSCLPLYIMCFICLVKTSLKYFVITLFEIF